MPLIRLQTSVPMDRDQTHRLRKDLSSQVAKALSKPESYLMVVLEPSTPMLMAGSDAPAAFAEIRSVGTISPDQASPRSEVVCGVVSEQLGVPGARISLNCPGVPGAMWGHDGGTFG